jgi:elongation factor P hydroxylase
MKSNKFVVAILATLSLVAGSPVMAATDPLAGQIQSDVLAKQTRIAGYRASAQYQEYTGAQRMEASIKEVMRLNGITKEAATARYMAAIVSQSGAVGRNPLYPFSKMAFNPAYQAWMDLGGGFYSGYNTVTGRHMTTLDQRASVRMDNFWYCPAGQTLVHGESASVCQ